MRQALMCYGDVTLHTYDIERTDNGLELKMHPQFARECRNWDSLNNFSKAREPKIFDGAMISHPVWGMYSYDRDIMNISLM